MPKKKSFRKLQGQVNRKEKLSVSELKEFDKLERYRRQAKKLRATHAFGDTFSKDQNLLYPEKWTPAQKARVTRYAKELGSLIAGESQTKRYFRSDHLELAIYASPQRKLLPGQKAAIFPVDDIKEKVILEFTRDHKIKKYSRGGIEETTFMFDPDNFIDDPVAELEKVLDDAPGQFFKFIINETESKDFWNADDMVDRMDSMIERYSKIEGKEVEDFIYGIKAYPKLRTKTKLEKRKKKHSSLVTKRQRGRLREIGKKKRALTKAQIKRLRTTGRY